MRLRFVPITSYSLVSPVALPSLGRVMPSLSEDYTTASPPSYSICRGARRGRMLAIYKAVHNMTIRAGHVMDKKISGRTLVSCILICMPSTQCLVYTKKRPRPEKHIPHRAALGGSRLPNRSMCKITISSP